MCLAIGSACSLDWKVAAVYFDQVMCQDRQHSHLTPLSELEQVSKDEDTARQE